MERFSLKKLVKNETIQYYIAFNILNNLLKLKMSKKHSENIISGIHAYTTVFFNNLHFTKAYMFHDLIQQLLIPNKKTINFAYIYHHLSSIYLLNGDQNIAKIILFLGELSNLANYPLYFFIHQKNKNKNIIYFLKIIQKILYIGIRGPIISCLLIIILIHNKMNKHLFSTIPIYFMGLVWSGKILKK